MVLVAGEEITVEGADAREVEKRAALAGVVVRSGGSVEVFARNVDARGEKGF